MEKLLIVEDNKALAKILSLHISRISFYDIVVAHSMEDAMDVISKNKVLAALLDLNLPDAPNGEVVDAMLKAGIPSIILTGNADCKIKQSFMSKPIVDYVVKEKMEDINYIAAKINRIAKNRSHKVLIVDDSAPVRNEMKKQLESQLYTTYTVGNGREAVGMMEMHPDITLVITDFNMPLMDGLELTKELRKTASKNNLAIVGISTEADSAVSFLRYGANDFITKPFTKDELVARVDNTIEALENIRKIGQMSITDFLSGAYNRSYFTTEFDKYFTFASEHEEPFAIASIDIDNLKSINDSYGNNAGDEVIKNVATVIKGSIKGNDIVARMNGGEFYLLLKNIEPAVAYRLLDDIRRQISIADIELGNDRHVKCTVSAGLCTEHADGKHEMIDTANGNLYKAKNSGKNQVVRS